MRFFSALLAFSILLTACAPAPDPLVIKKLEEMIEIRGTIAKEATLLHELGKANPAPSLIALSEAKIALATEQNNGAAIIAELEQIVKRLNDLSKRERALAEEDRKSRTELGEMMVHVIEAEIRLQRAKTKYGIQ